MIGVGNAWRRDDGAGLAAAARVRAAGGIALEHEGDGIGLIHTWAGAAHVTVIDAAASGAPPGTLHRFDANMSALPAHTLRSSTHAFGVPDAIELARALGTLPPRLEVYAVEGEDFSTGRSLSPAVEAAVDALVRALQVL